MLLIKDFFKSIIPFGDVIDAMLWMGCCVIAVLVGFLFIRQGHENRTTSSEVIRDDQRVVYFFVGGLAILGGIGAFIAWFLV